MASKILQGSAALEALPCATQPPSVGSQWAMGCTHTSRQKKPMREGSSLWLSQGATSQPLNPPANLPTLCLQKRTAVTPSHSHAVTAKGWGAKGERTPSHLRTSSVPPTSDFHRKQWLCFPFSFHYMPKYKYVREL